MDFFTLANLSNSSYIPLPSNLGFFDMQHIIIIIIIIININAMVKNKEQVNKLESEAGEVRGREG